MFEPDGDVLRLLAEGLADLEDGRTLISAKYAPCGPERTKFGSLRSVSSAAIALVSQ